MYKYELVKLFNLEGLYIDSEENITTDNSNNISLLDYLNKYDDYDDTWIELDTQIIIVDQDYISHIKSRELGVKKIIDNQLENFKPTAKEDTTIDYNYSGFITSVAQNIANEVVDRANSVEDAWNMINFLDDDICRGFKQEIHNCVTFIKLERGYDEN